MTPSSRELYARRMGKVLDYIGAHLSEPLSVEELSRVAGFSKYHFHRQFTAFTGITVARFVALLRLKRASLQLAFGVDQRIIEVAYEAGFANPESFSRAFKSAQGQSPSQFRRSPDWERWGDNFRTDSLRENSMNIKIVDFPETQVACLEHKGSPATLMASVGRFIEWRKSCAASPVKTSGTYGVPYGDPEKTPPEDFKFDICGTVQRAVEPNPFGVVTKTIPGGRCAVATHHGSTDAIDKTVLALYREWLPHSGEEPRDFPCFFHYIERMPAVSEHAQVTDVYLPLK